MPLLAAFIGNLAVGLVAVFSRFMSYSLALKLAAYTAWIVVLGAFVTSVFVCVNSLVGMLGAFFGGGTLNGGIVSAFMLGLSIFIPANAAAVIGCLGSVWIACQVYKIQKEGMHNYSK